MSQRLGQRLIEILSAPASEPGAPVHGVLAEIAERFDARLAVLWTVDERSGLLVWDRDWAAGDETAELRAVQQRLTFAAGAGLPGRVLAQRRAIRLDDLASAPEFARADMASAAGLRAGTAAPLVSGDVVVGVVELFTAHAEAPNDDQLADLRLAASQLAIYLGRLRVEDRLRASEATSASITQAALDCIITMDHTGEVLDFNPAAEVTFGYARSEAVGRQLGDLIVPPELRGAHQQALARYVETGTRTILGQRLEIAGMRADGSEFPVELTVTRLGTHEPPQFVGFIRDISARREMEAAQAALLRDALSARAQAEAAGVRTEAAREAAERALAEAEASRRRIAFLADVDREMAGSLDWETTLRHVVGRSVPELADWAQLALADPDGRPTVVAVAPDDAAPRPAGGDVAHAPLDTPSGTIGTLTFVRRPGWPFTDEDLDVVRTLGARAAVHIRSARLYKERSHIAETLQASLRPRALPDIPGAELAARYRPAGDYNEVGGDFYEVFRSGDGVWTAIVGDVSGKGAEAAAVTALARHTLRTGSMVHDEPSANLALLNRAMLEDLSPGDFCTVVYARICPSDPGFEVRFANGGHPPPIVVHARGTIETIETGHGMLVGAVPDAPYEEATLHLDSGDLLVLYTDGVTEIRTSDVQLGERELRATLEATAGAPAEEVVAAIERRAVDLQDGRPRDDMAIVAFRAL